ncbi:MAG: patatin family protein [Butyricicoccus sp.]|nr:patatin family protein [Butyricicoccus sp.]
MKTAIIDVGGGQRGVYAAGVLDRCLDMEISFDLGIGVSAGSANLASFTARQPRRNLRFYTEYAMRAQYMSIGNFLRKRSFIDLDYVYGTLSNSDGESPLDYAAMTANPMELLVVATDANAGEPKYFDKSDLQQDGYDIFKASSSIPFVCRPYVIGGVPYFDGALADPVPFLKAFELGCEKVVLLLTLPQNIVRKPGKDPFLASRIEKAYPISAVKLAQRADRYNMGVSLAQEYAAEGQLLIVAPDHTCGVTTLKRDRPALHALYKKGYRDAGKIFDFLQK